jgi:predicted phosphodiesterase
MILFAGDPHRNFSPIIRACLARPPANLILLGDVDCQRPLRQEFASVLAAGWRVSWILGNHDCETEAAYDNLVNDCPDGDLGFCVVEVDGCRVAGLPGVFKPSIWYPRLDDGSRQIEPPRFRNSDTFLAAQPESRRWRGGLPLWHRDSIFPDDVDRLAKLRFDILVTHEAPSCHRHGFAVIDDLAAAGGASLIVHGHHHDSYSATLPNGIAVRGLGLAEPWPFG